LESLIRLSEAVAKIRSSPVVTREDVDEAVRLMYVATQKAATDPRTGRIDMDMITTGTSARERENVEALRQAVAEILEAKTAEGGARSFGVQDLVGFLQAQSDVEVPMADLLEACRRLAFEGVVTFNERAQRVTVV
jgi:DNA replication licensing factor MCM4